MKIRIHQIDTRKASDKAFLGADQYISIFNSFGVDSDIYDCVFDGEVDARGLNGVWRKFNLDLPDGYKGRSLSVSDIIEVVEDVDVNPGFYYCDNFGYKKVKLESVDDVKMYVFEEKLK